MKISRKNIISILLIAFFALVIVVPISHVFAATDTDTNTINYVPLAPLPGIGAPGAEGGPTSPSVTSLSGYLVAMFRILIGLSALLAVVMITWGGIEMMTSVDSESNYKSGKEKVNNALLGLLLAAASWLILYTINPKLLEFNLDITPIDDIAAPVTSTTSIYTKGEIDKIQYCYQDGSQSKSDPQKTYGKFTYDVTDVDAGKQAYKACLAASPKAISRLNPPPEDGCPAGTYQEQILCLNLGVIQNP